MALRARRSQGLPKRTGKDPSGGGDWERSRGRRHQSLCRRTRLGLLSQRRKTTTSTAGMNGPHHVFNPNAASVVDPPFTNAMIVPAQANALIRFSELNLAGFVRAYAQAIGMAVRSPGRKRPISTNPVSLECT